MPGKSALKLNIKYEGEGVGASMRGPRFVDVRLLTR
jgi:hypothetical protein